MAIIATSIILMGLCESISMTFALSSTERVTRYYSHFSLMPFGYGNWLPIVAVVSSIISMLLLLISFKRDCRSAIMICLSVTIFSTLLSWMIFSTFTFMGLGICVLHILAIITQIKPKNMVKQA